MIKEQNAKIKNVGKVTINKGGDKCVEVSGIYSDGNPLPNYIENASSSGANTYQRYY
jgi:hypothetical protein